MQDPQEYYTRFRKFVEDENELGKTALAQYIIHRRVILGLIGKGSQTGPGDWKVCAGKIVHSLIFPMRSTSDDVPFDQQNLWIIDERLTFHSFLLIGPAPSTPSVRFKAMRRAGLTSSSSTDLLLSAMKPNHSSR